LRSWVSWLTGRGPGGAGASTGLHTALTSTLGCGVGLRLREAALQNAPRAPAAMAPRKSTYAPANYGSVAEALVGLYGEKVRPAEQQMLFDRFSTSLLSDAELLAKPMVLLLGQYSAGKTTFIRYLAGEDFPGIHIGPEPTTDGFAALMDGTSPTPIPGNAATADKRRPFRALSRHAVWKSTGGLGSLRRPWRTSTPRADAVIDFHAGATAPLSSTSSASPNSSATSPKT